VRNALGVDSLRGDMISVVSAPFDLPQPVVTTPYTAVAPQDMIAKIQANPKPVVALAALVVLLILGLAAVFILRPKKSKALDAGQQPNALTPGTAYAELPASSQMQTAMQDMQDMQEGYDEPEQIEERRAPLKLPPLPTTPEREQAIATVEQRPDAALRVTRQWLRQ
jgi:flagellar M-ring protein FliF